MYLLYFSILFHYLLPCRKEIATAFQKEFVIVVAASLVLVGGCCLGTLGCSNPDTPGTQRSRRHRDRCLWASVPRWGLPAQMSALLPTLCFQGCRPCLLPTQNLTCVSLSITS